MTWQDMLEGRDVVRPPDERPWRQRWGLSVAIWVSGALCFALVMFLAWSFEDASDLVMAAAVSVILAAAATLGFSLGRRLPVQNVRSMTVPRMIVVAVVLFACCGTVAGLVIGVWVAMDTSPPQEDGSGATQVFRGVVYGAFVVGPAWGAFSTPFAATAWSFARCTARQRNRRSHGAPT